MPATAEQSQNQREAEIQRQERRDKQTEQEPQSPEQLAARLETEARAKEQAIGEQIVNPRIEALQRLGELPPEVISNLESSYQQAEEPAVRLEEILKATGLKDLPEGPSATAEQILQTEPGLEINEPKIDEAAILNSEVPTQPEPSVEGVQPPEIQLPKEPTARVEDILASDVALTPEPQGADFSKVKDALPKEPAINIDEILKVPVQAERPNIIQDVKPAEKDTSKTKEKKKEQPAEKEQTPEEKRLEQLRRERTNLLKETEQLIKEFGDLSTLFEKGRPAEENYSQSGRLKKPEKIVVAGRFSFDPDELNGPLLSADQKSAKILDRIRLADVQNAKMRIGRIATEYGDEWYSDKAAGAKATFEQRKNLGATQKAWEYTKDAANFAIGIPNKPENVVGEAAGFVGGTSRVFVKAPVRMSWSIVKRLANSIQHGENPLMLVGEKMEKLSKLETNLQQLQTIEFERANLESKVNFRKEHGTWDDEVKKARSTRMQRMLEARVADKLGAKVADSNNKVVLDTLLQHKQSGKFRENLQFPTAENAGAKYTIKLTEPLAADPTVPRIVEHSFELSADEVKKEQEYAQLVVDNEAAIRQIIGEILRNTGKEPLKRLADKNHFYFDINADGNFVINLADDGQTLRKPMVLSQEFSNSLLNALSKKENLKDGYLKDATITTVLEESGLKKKKEKNNKKSKKDNTTPDSPTNQAPDTQDGAIDDDEEDDDEDQPTTQPTTTPDPTPTAAPEPAEVKTEFQKVRDASRSVLETIRQLGNDLSSSQELSSMYQVLDANKSLPLQVRFDKFNNIVIGEISTDGKYIANPLFVINRKENATTWKAVESRAGNEVKLLTTPENQIAVVTIEDPSTQTEESKTEVVRTATVNPAQGNNPAGPPISVEAASTPSQNAAEQNPANAPELPTTLNRTSEVPPVSPADIIAESLETKENPNVTDKNQQAAA